MQGNVVFSPSPRAERDARQRGSGRRRYDLRVTSTATPAPGFSLKAMLLGRCPRCRQGRIFPPFWSLRLLSMNPGCEVCGLHFERESGYFVGAMYVSYTLGV